MSASAKPLGHKAYGSIGHLPNSRMGPADHHIEAGQAAICTVKTRDAHDLVIVTEKLDGSCVSAARIGNDVVALGRAGYLAATSKYKQHHLWAQWVANERGRLLALLGDGERLVGEWLAQAHGTRYQLPHEPFVAFDLMRGHERAPHGEFLRRVSGRFVTPRCLHIGGPYSVEEAKRALEFSGHGAQDPVEGAVWRVERHGAVDFLAKWVRQDKADGCFLPEISGQPEIWQVPVSSEVTP